MDAREQILGALGANSGAAEQGMNHAPAANHSALVPRLRESETAGWQLFRARLEELGGHVLELDDRPLGAAVLRALDELSIPARHAFVDEDAKPIVEMDSTADVWSADVGLTLADLAVAETGSILLSAGPGRVRLASLAPPIHVAIVSNANIVETLEDALTHPLVRTSVLITGPSRTADIEGILVRGVHGPREIVVVRVKGQE